MIPSKDFENRRKNVFVKLDRSVPLGQMKERGSVTMTSLKRFERMIEQLLFGRLSVEAVAEVNRELVKRFGFSRLGEDPVLMANGVLKRGKIRGASEGEVVREFVADQSNASLIGAGVYDRLAKILDEWECSESRE